RAGYDKPALDFYALFQARITAAGESSGLGMPPGLAGDAMVARGDFDEALRLYREQERICRANGNQVTLQLMLADQASILIARGAYDEAMQLAIEQEQICRELGMKYDLLRSLGFQSFILKARGEFARSMQI